MTITKFIHTPLTITKPSVAPLTVGTTRAPLDLTALPALTPEQVQAEAERRAKLKQQIDALLARMGEKEG